MSFAERSEHADQRIVDDLGDLLTDPKSMRATGDEIIKNLLEFIDGAKSYEDALSGLASMYPKMGINALENILTNASKAATAVGRTHAAE